MTLPHSMHFMHEDDEAIDGDRTPSGAMMQEWT
jgi:hypothetical protein